MMNKDIKTVSVREFYRTIALILQHTPATEQYPTVYLLGSTGTGKTTQVRDLARALSIPITFLNVGGQEGPDLLGLPTERDGRVFFAQPWWFDHQEDMNSDTDQTNPAYVEQLKAIFSCIPQERMPQRILFLDELNRIHPDAFNSIMNVVLEGRHQDKKMSKRTLIICAGNLNQETGDESYTVNEFDPAQRDRLIQLHVKPTITEWVTYAAPLVHPGIVEWAETHPDKIRSFNIEKGAVSLRRLTQLGVLLKEASEELIMSPDILLLTGSLIPTLLAPEVVAFVRKANESLTLDAILSDYSSIRPRIKRFLDGNILSPIHRICDEVSKATSLPEKNLPAGLFEFLEDIPTPSLYQTLRSCTSNVKQDPKIFNLLESCGKRPEIVRRLTRAGATSGG